MSTTAIMKLCNIAAKRPQQHGTFLLVARRICRLLNQRNDDIRAEANQFRREARKMEQYRPFTDRSIDELNEKAIAHRAQEGYDLRKVLKAFGRSIIHDPDGVADALGFERLCDLLAVNVVEREQARQEGVTDLAGLVFGEQVEESASRRRQQWTEAPLLSACRLAFFEFIRECPAGQLPDPFAPGAPFGPKLPPQLKVVR
ncbi:hypothetical protein [Pseudomonas sp. MWU16-30317]|uniref:hypothetical protein n=1 Tax=Pseudomonas sp. MWU16-30317 TaxID=2878095 RepID=UPI001CF9C4EE|nr:hypothetical protein [Pseudomonas sp. MWU16-30317]